jgi:hypothetical protein
VIQRKEEGGYDYGDAAKQAQVLGTRLPLPWREPFNTTSCLSVCIFASTNIIIIIIIIIIIKKSNHEYAYASY